MFCCNVKDKTGMAVLSCILFALFLTTVRVSAETLLPSDSVSSDSLEIPDTAKGLGALTVPPVISPVLPNGCITCTMINPYDPECATNFLIGKNYMLPAGKLITYASNRLWFVKKSLGNGDIGIAAGPSLETNALYPVNFIYDDLSRWKRRITDSLGIDNMYYYYPYGGDG
jgi:hypothetical protein